MQDFIQFRHDRICINSIRQNLVQDGEHLLPLLLADSAADCKGIVAARDGRTAGTTCLGLPRGRLAPAGHSEQ
jgi:hypothetical protein